MDLKRRNGPVAVLGPRPFEMRNIKLLKGLFKKQAWEESQSAEPEDVVDDFDGGVGSTSDRTSRYQSIDNHWESMEGQTHCTKPEPTAGDVQTHGPSLTDEYTDWTHSLQAFQGAIFHSMLYLVVGILAYSVVFERWSVVDSLYFSVTLFTTVGYGDLHPDNEGSELFTMAFAFYGIAIVGVFLAIFGDLAFQKRHDLQRKKIDQLRRNYLKIFGKESSVEPEGMLDEPMKPSLLVESFRICKAQAPFLAVLFAMGTPVVFLENWTFIKGLYWGVITGTTIGLGDEIPQHELSRAVCIVFIPLAVAFTGRFLSLVASAYVERNCHAEEEKFMSRSLTLSDLRKMDINSDGTVSPGEFLLFMLVMLQKVDQNDIETILALFHKLDKVGRARNITCRCFIFNCDMVEIVF